MINVIIGLLIIRDNGF